MSTKQIDDFVTYSYSYDTIQFTPAVSSGNVLPVVIASSFVFSPNDINILTSTTEQYQKMQYFMNAYESYRFESIEMEYIPRYSFSNPQTFSIPATTTTESQFLADFVSANNEIWWTRDKQDSVVRSSLDEFYQVRLQSDRVGGSIHQRHKLRISPHLLDVMQVTDSQSTVGLATGTNNPLQATTSSGFGASLNSNTFQPAPWMSTKTAFGNTGAAAITFNLDFICNALKEYLYVPFSPPIIASTAVPAMQYGILRWVYTFNFKDMDNRALVTVATLYAENALAGDKSNALRIVAGGEKLYSSKRKAQWNSTLESAARKKNETENPSLSAAQETLHPSVTSASNRSESVHQASAFRRTPLVR